MSPTELAGLIGIELSPAPEANPARGLLAQHAGSYVCEADRIVTLNLYESPPGRPPEDWLHALPDLRYLNLGACRLNRFDLRDAPRLEVLWLHDNPELNELKLPRRHDHLIRVDLSGCGLRRITWPECPQLEFLDCSRQQDRSLISFQMDRAAPALCYLDLSHNSLPEIELPAECPALKVLCLEHNELSRVTFAGGIPELESLRLNNNRIRKLPNEWADELEVVQNLFLEENALSNVYLGRLQEASPQQAVSIVRDILEAQRDSGESLDNECKVLIVGNSGVGKTTLYERLNGGDFADHVSTDGVIIATHDWPPGGPKYRLQFWDFGGQDIYHATHRLFLQSSAVYIVAWDPTSEEEEYSIRPEDREKGYRNFKLPYWLDYVYRSATRNENARYRRQDEAVDAPVLVVQTKKGRFGVRERPFINARFAPHFAYYLPGLAIESNPDEVAKDADDGYHTLERELRNALRKAQPEQEIPTSYVQLRKKLREKQEEGTPWISLTDYRDLAREVETEFGKLGRETDILRDWLHRAGVVYYRPEVTGERIILDQRWATKAIYTILRRTPNYQKQIEDAGGEFTGAQLLSFWREQDYLRDEGDEILFEQFMLASELAYRIDAAADLPFPERRYRAPQLLPRESQSAGLRKRIERRPEDWWRLRLFNEFLHPGIIRRLIIRLHDPGEPDRVWRSGLILRDEEGFYALAEVNANGDAVDIYVEKDSPTLLRSLLSEIEQLPVLDRPERIWVSADGEREVDLRELRETRRKTAETLKDQNGDSVSVAQFADLLSQDAEERNYVDRLASAPSTSQSISSDEPAEPVQATVADPTSQSPEHNGPWSLSIHSALLPDYRELGIEKEANLIAEKIKRLGNFLHPDLIFGNPSVPATKDYLRSAVRRDAPSILHFCGHGEQQPGVERVKDTRGMPAAGRVSTCGIVLRDESGQAAFLSETALFSLLSGCKQWTTPQAAYPFLQLVVLNACHTAAVACRVSELGSFAIGVAGEVPDIKAIEFAGVFYEEFHRKGATELPQAFGHARYIVGAPYRLFHNGGELLPEE